MRSFLTTGRLLLTLLLAAQAPVCAGGSREPYPFHAVRLLIAEPEGGVADRACRLASRLAEPAIGTVCEAVNDPDAAKTLGKAKADGYTIACLALQDPAEEAELLCALATLPEPDRRTLSVVAPPGLDGTVGTTLARAYRRAASSREFTDWCAAHGLVPQEPSSR